MSRDAMQEMVVDPRRPLSPGPSPARLMLAAQLCLDDELTDEEIARRLGISRRALVRWKHLPEFQAAYQRQAARLQAALDAALAAQAAALAARVVAGGHDPS